MATQREKIKNYAKELYTQYDSEGRKKYSFRDISTEIQQKFNKKTHFSTVAKWAKEESWDGLNQKIKQHAIAKAQDEKFSTEEKIVDARSDDLAEVYKYGKQMAQIGTKVFQDYYSNKAHKHISVKEALAAARIGVNIMLRLNDIPDAEEADFGMIYIPDNGR